MQRRLPWLIGIVLIGVQSGCETGTFVDDIGTVIGQPSKAEEAEMNAPISMQPVDSVGKVEIGRTEDGILITAYGLAPGAGYGAPALRPRREGKPSPDGFIEYDFVAHPPDPGFDLPAGNVRTRAMRAIVVVRSKSLTDTQGIRVYGLKNFIQSNF